MLAVDAHRDDAEVGGPASFWWQTSIDRHLDATGRTPRGPHVQPG